MTRPAHDRGALARAGRRAAACVFVLVLTGMSISGCVYRIAPPAALDEMVRVEIAVNKGRLVRTQSDLQSAIASAIEYQLGWKVNPHGSACISLTIDPEIIQTVGTVQGDLPAEWTITIRGNALFTCKHGTYVKQTPYAGTGSSTGTVDESAALVTASQAAGLSLAAWLDGLSHQWPKPPVAP